VAGKRVLVLATESPDDSSLREQLGDADEVRVVTPATKVSKLDWLTGAEDDARAEAAETAEQVADAVGGEVDRTSQNTDAAQNVEDALRTFQPDEILVYTGGGDSTWLEDEAVRKLLEASGAPIRRL
jgi:ABC-type Na+ efflux pump permease subunit